MRIYTYIRIDTSHPLNPVSFPDLSCKMEYLGSCHFKICGVRQRRGLSNQIPELVKCYIVGLVYMLLRNYTVSTYPEPLIMK